jgi:hypothetical protein
MAKQIQLTIPKPCHEDWDAMTAVERGRFCGACQKQVVDFSNMSDSQVAAFFKKKSTGSVCGRFTEDQLGKAMDIPKKRIPWVKYFFQLTLPLFLASLKSNAQRTKGKIVVSSIETKANCTKEPVAVKDETIWLGKSVVKKVVIPDIEISGIVIGADRESVPYASLAVKGTTTGVHADSSGAFRINIPSPKEETISLTVSSVGYETKDVIIPRGTRTRDFTIQLEVNQLKEVIVIGHHGIGCGTNYVVGEMVIETPEIIDNPDKAIIEVIDIKDTKEDIVPSATHVYPNPLPSGATINIKCENMDEDYYSLQLMTIGGQVVFRKEIWINKEARVLNIALPRVTPGTYLLVMTGRQKQKRFTDRIIILP